jgi:predicted O-linked N-acetylglucosamine transferase (SPINDLY family)
VPVVTLAGVLGFARSGASLLQALDLENLVAEDTTEYIGAAARLAADLPALSELRQTLRERVRRSELNDGPGFCRKLEAAYRGMWRERCDLYGEQRQDMPPRAR